MQCAHAAQIFVPAESSRFSQISRVCALVFNTGCDYYSLKNATLDASAAILSLFFRAHRMNELSIQPRISKNNILYFLIKIYKYS